MVDIDETQPTAANDMQVDKSTEGQVPPTKQYPNIAPPRTDHFRFASPFIPGARIWMGDHWVVIR